MPTRSVIKPVRRHKKGCHNKLHVGQSEGWSVETAIIPNLSESRTRISCAALHLDHGFLLKLCSKHENIVSETTSEDCMEFLQSVSQ